MKFRWEDIIISFSKISCPAGVAITEYNTLVHPLAYSPGKMIFWLAGTDKFLVISRSYSVDNTAALYERSGTAISFLDGIGTVVPGTTYGPPYGPVILDDGTILLFLGPSVGDVKPRKVLQIGISGSSLTSAAVEVDVDWLAATGGAHSSGACNVGNYAVALCVERLTSTTYLKTFVAGGPGLTVVDSALISPEPNGGVEGCWSNGDLVIVSSNSSGGSVHNIHLYRIADGAITLLDSATSTYAISFVDWHPDGAFAVGATTVGVANSKVFIDVAGDILTVTAIPSLDTDVITGSNCDIMWYNTVILLTGFQGDTPIIWCYDSGTRTFTPLHDFPTYDAALGMSQLSTDGEGWVIAHNTNSSSTNNSFTLFKVDDL